MRARYTHNCASRQLPFEQPLGFVCRVVPATPHQALLPPPPLPSRKREPAASRTVERFRFPELSILPEAGVTCWRLRIPQPPGRREPAHNLRQDPRPRSGRSKRNTGTSRPRGGRDRVCPQPPSLHLARVHRQGRTKLRRGPPPWPPAAPGWSTHFHALSVRRAKLPLSHLRPEPDSPPRTVPRRNDVHGVSTRSGPR